MKLFFEFPKNEHLSYCHLGNWVVNNLIEYKFNNDNDHLLWINGKNNILLWQADGQYIGSQNLFDVKCNHIITMNTVYPNTIPSYYQSRDENKLMKFINENKYLNCKERIQNTIFLGSIKDGYQGSFRKKVDWSKYIDEFDCPNFKNDESYKYDQEGYYKALSKTRYGLCIRGGGPKCWRDIEYLALGTVLLVTEGVDVENYHNPLKENIHYIKINNPDEIKEKIKLISEEQWNYMSQQCISWYINNCRYDGSIKILEEIVSKLN